MSKENKKVEEMDGMSGFFSEDIAESTAVEVKSSGGADENVYATSLKHENVKNGIYKSRVRFIKNPFNTPDEVLNVLHKYMYFLPNPDNPDSRIVIDCTSNYGETYNIISQAFFYLKGTKNPSLVALAKNNFSRKSYYYSLLKVISDVQQPELEGKIKLYRFAKQVNDKLDEVSKDDPSVGVKGTNFSHPFTGKDFIIDVRLETFKDEKTGMERELTSYSKSKFVDEPSILEIPDYDGKVEASQEYAKELFSYIKENSPNLADYKVAKWDNETEQLAIRAVRAVIDDDAIFNQIYRKQYKKSYVADSDGLGSSSDTGKSGLQIDENAMLEKEESQEDIETKEKSTTKVEEKSTSTTTAKVEEKSDAAKEIYSQEDETPDDEDEDF